MERETIYLDNDEEITSVVDKLKNADLASVDLVIPKEALLLQSVVNLKLLKKQADTLGKEITIVTQDKVGKKLAERIGIPVVASPGEAPKEVKMSEADTSEKISDADIELKEEEATQLKPGAEGIVAPTAEVVEPAGATTGPSNIKTEQPEESNSAKRSLSASGGLDKKGKKKRRWKKWAILGGLALIGLVVAAYIYIPLANITIKLAAEKKKLDISFAVDKNATGVDTGNQVIAGSVINEDKESSKKYPATGKKKTGVKAKGSITVSDKGYNSKPNSTTLVAGTRFVNPAGLVFRSTSNVTVPGFEMVGGNVSPGTASVNVEADQVGEQYNVGATTFVLPALGTDKLTGSSAAAMGGGSSKDVQFVTQTDINSAKEDIKGTMNSEMKKLALEKTAREQRLLDEAIKITEVSATPSVSVNGEAAEFELRAKYNVKAIVFTDEDIKSLATSELSDQIGSGKEIVEKDSLASSVEFVSADFDKGTMKARLSGEAYIATKLDQGKIKTDISGDPEYKALETLKAIDGVEETEIKFFPPFLKRMPRIRDHIYIKTSISKVQN